MRCRVAVLVLTVLAACSSGGGHAQPASSSSSSASALPPSTIAPTTAPPATEPSCAAPAPPSTAVDTSTATGDVDGDGHADDLVVYADGTETNPGPWHLVASTGKGPRLATEISGVAAGEQRVRVLGAATIAGPSQVIFVQVGTGASDTIVGLFTVAGCSIVHVSSSLLAVGGSVTHLDGLRCGDGALSVLQADSDDGSTYRTSAQRFVIDAGSLTADGAPDTATMAASDPRLSAFASIDCPGVSLS